MARGAVGMREHGTATIGPCRGRHDESGCVTACLRRTRTALYTLTIFGFGSPVFAGSALLRASDVWGMVFGTDTDGGFTQYAAAGNDERRQQLDQAGSHLGDH